MTERIKQIMPALGWVAVYKGKLREFSKPLVGWALVERQDGKETWDAVVGLEEGGDSVDTVDGTHNFLRYEYEGVEEV